jgi:flagellar hook-associated protein 3 FlgL
VTRITQSMVSRNLLADLNDVTNRIANTQRKLSSGKELNMPSDDPFAVSRALQLRADVGQYHQYARNVSEADGWQSATDTALAQVGDVALRARELLVQGASEPLGPDGRESIATEIEGLIDSIKTVGNSQYAGRYIFSGSETLTPAYTVGGADTFGGNAELMRREIGPNTTVELNVVGGNVLGDGTSGLIGTLRTIVDDLRNGNMAALQGADMTGLETAHDAVTTARATVGAVQNRLETAQNRLAALEESTSRLLSETEDADMAKTLIDFSMQQAVYQSALKSGANIIQPSLMDFLRS